MFYSYCLIFLFTYNLANINCHVYKNKRNIRQILQHHALTFRFVARHGVIFLLPFSLYCFFLLFTMTMVE